MKKFAVLPVLIFVGISFATLSGSAQTISSSTTSAQTISSGTLMVNSGVTVNVGSGGNTPSGNGTVAVTATGSSTITNDGTIEELDTASASAQNGRAIRVNTANVVLTINNNAGALIISGDSDAIQMNKSSDSVTLNNRGAITSLNASAGGAQAIDWNAIGSGSNTLNNYATGVIQANDADSVRPGANGFINNDGVIKSVQVNPAATGTDGIDAQTNSGVTIVNGAAIGGETIGSSLIEGAFHGITGGNTTTGVYAMSITNNAGATIQGDNGSGINIDGINGSETVTIVNHGTITGNGVTGDGDGVDVDGLVNLTNTGTIKSLQAHGDTSEGVTVGGGTIVNSGTIEGDNTAANGGVGRGITLAGVDKDTNGNAIPIQSIYANTTVTNNAGGLIKGNTDSGIAVLGTTASAFTVTITNNAGATIEGGGSTVAAIEMGASLNNETVTDSGTIVADSSGKAVDFGSGTNVMNIVGGSASIIGNITGGSGNNTLTVNPGSGNGFTYAYAISNFATAEVQSGTFTLAGSIGGATAITVDSGATMAFSEAGGGAISNAVTDNGTVAGQEAAGSTNTLSGSVTGSGGFTQSGAGTTVLSGTMSYTGATAVSAGTLEVDSTLTSSTVTVSGGVLQGTGTVGTVDVTGGTLGAGTASSTGTLTIDNSLTLGAGSTTAIRINGTTAGTGYDQIVIAHGATATVGGNLNLTPNAMVGGQTFTVVKQTDASSITGQFSGVTNTLGNALTFTLASNTAAGGGITVQAVQGSFSSFAANPSQSALASALNTAAADPRAAALISTLNGLPGSQLATAFQLISPAQQTVVSQTALSSSQASFGTVQNRMGDIRAGSTGLSLSQFNLMDQNIPASEMLASLDTPIGAKAFRPAPDNRWGFFAAADGNFGDTDGKISQSSYDGVGFTAGSDYRITPAVAVGFAAGYDYSKTDFNNSGSNSTANTARFGPYATWQDRHGDWVDGTLGGAYHWFDSNRDALGGTATSSTTGTEFDTSLQYGHDFKVGQWTLTPSFGFDYLHLIIDGYTETGSVAPLTLQDQVTDSFKSELGQTFSHGFKWHDVAWNPYVQAGWNHEFLDASQSVTARFASGAGTSFTTEGDNLGHDSATFGAGLETQLSQTLSVNLGYSGEANQRYENHSFNASVRVQF